MLFNPNKKSEWNTAEQVPKIVEKLLTQTIEIGASDLHLLPNEKGLDVKWRINGVLQHQGTIPKDISENVVIRLKVLAGLLTYQTQLPQEGRLQIPELSLPMRVSSFPTVYGEKIVARLFDQTETQKAMLGGLDLSDATMQSLKKGLSRNTGAVIIVGPAGSGKTTTAYACLREIISMSDRERSIVSLEDPVEVLVPGVTQSETAPEVGFDFAKGLRSLVRQDPEVIFVGEIRDHETMKVAMQAAMTGQLVITTFHASDCVSAIERLLDMGLPPYVIRCATNLIIAQRLIRVLCGCAKDDIDNQNITLQGKTIAHPKQPGDCQDCQHTGYSARKLLIEPFDLNCPNVVDDLKGDMRKLSLREILEKNGITSLHKQAIDLVSEGVTSLSEVTRLFGIN